MHFRGDKLDVRDFIDCLCMQGNFFFARMKSLHALHPKVQDGAATNKAKGYLQN
jgi:hypothetical protein